MVYKIAFVYFIVTYSHERSKYLPRILLWITIYRKMLWGQYLQYSIKSKYLPQNSLWGTAQKMKLSIKDFVHLSSFLRIWSHLLKKSLMENFIFCAVTTGEYPLHDPPLCIILLKMSDRNVTKFFWRYSSQAHLPASLKESVNLMP